MNERGIFKVQDEYLEKKSLGEIFPPNSPEAVAQKLSGVNSHFADYARSILENTAGNTDKI